MHGSGPVYGSLPIELNTNHAGREIKAGDLYLYPSLFGLSDLASPVFGSKVDDADPACQSKKSRPPRS